jgi:hypothetical protein
MAKPPRTALSSTGLEELLRAARLDLVAERHELVAASLSGVQALIDGLDDVALKETPPATAFDPRWT